MNDNFRSLGGKTENQSYNDGLSDDKMSIGSGLGSIGAGGSLKGGVPSHKVAPYKGRRATNMKVNVQKQV